MEERDTGLLTGPLLDLLNPNGTKKEYRVLSDG